MGAGTDAGTSRRMTSITIAQDLRPTFGPARDQDPRPTCMAFAASDAHAGARPGWEPLSVEWAYYHALKRDGSKPHDGVCLATMLATLKGDGQPVESAWPYISSLFTDLQNYKPPGTVGSVFRRDHVPTTATVDEMIAQLDRGHPVLFTMSISRSFFTVLQTGIISAVEPVEPNRVHALVAVGHGSAGSDKYILVRNSWGQGWAMNGYAWLHTDYLKPRLLVAATMAGEL